MLKEDHDRLRKLLEEIDSFEEVAVEKRKKSASELFMELEIHLRLEEEIFYPSIFSGVDFATALEEHQRMMIWMKNLKEMSPHHEVYKIEFSRFSDTLKRHLEEEEQELFPRSEDLLKKGPRPTPSGVKDFLSGEENPPE
jgi:hemerythrin-like domain-containing protein